MTQDSLNRRFLSDSRSQQPPLRQRHSLRSTLWLLLIVAACNALFAQTQAQAQAQARPVTLPVTIFDKQGQVDTSLTKANLTLTTDSQPQTIASLTPASKEPLTLGILVDTSNNQRDDLAQQVTASQNFLDQMLTRPGDKAFVIQFDYQVNLLSDPTNAKDTLHKALARLNEPNFGYGDRSGASDSSAHNARNNTIYDALYLAAEDLMQKQTGRKIIVLVSDGVDIGSKTIMNELMESLQRANIQVYSIAYKQPEEPRQKENRNQDNRRRSSTTWPGSGGGWPGSTGGGLPGSGTGWPGSGNPGNTPNGTNGTNTGNNGGNKRNGQPQWDRTHTDGQKILSKISNLTGASMYVMDKKTPVEANFTGISREIQGQLLLTYTPQKLSNTDYHRVILKAKSKDLTPQTRDGFYNR
jgi:VWFA-related protein